MRQAARAEREQPSSELILDVRNAVHRYGSYVALHGVSISARRGEFLTLLGQSGSGKTTLLRIIAGLEMPTSIETLDIGGQDVRTKPAAQRDCCTVFQGYALFPHMSVLENVEFGMRVRGVAAGERKARALEALGVVRLQGKENRRVHQLSGGEKQRVGLARAIVTRPSILLLDEPLGALDERLRIDMQSELLTLQKSLGITFIYVTHSQDEALTMSDRVALMRGGRIEQLGAPSDLYEKPVNRFVADFMGCSNLIAGQVSSLEEDGRVVLDVEGHRFSGRWTGRKAPEKGARAHMAIRAERISASPGGANQVPGRLERAVYKGARIEGMFATPIGTVVANLGAPSIPLGTDIVLRWASEQAAVVPDDEARTGP